MPERRTWASYVIWGSIAVSAVLAASFTIALVVGAHRGIQIAGTKRPSVPPVERPQASAPAPSPATGASEHEIARINDALRTLAAERDRLAARLEQIERTVGDITASIRERSSAAAVEPIAAESMAKDVKPASGAKSADTTEPKGQQAADKKSTEFKPAAATETVNGAAAAAPPASEATASTPKPAVGTPIDIFRPYASAKPLVAPPSPNREPMQIHGPLVTASRSAPETTSVTRTEFAIDLGSDTTIDGLRALWANLRGNHGATLGSMRPLVSIRPGRSPGGTELHLIAGPMANAGAAARACAELQAKGVACQTTVFDGQRLAPN